MKSGNWRCCTSVAEVENSFEIVQEETFAPILYLIKYEGGGRKSHRTAE